MSCIRPSKGCHMLTCRFNNVFVASWPLDNKSAVIYLNKDLALSCLLNVVYHLGDRTALSKTQSGMFAPRDARAALISSGVRGRIASVMHQRSSAPDVA